MSIHWMGYLWTFLAVFLAVFRADVSRRCPRGPLFPVEGAARGLRHGRPLAPARKR